ncbi:MAG: HAD-IIA family hydrolase [Acidimicrobiales bacterium]|jgi:4-nitrophenyl phosphatase
MTWVLDCDGVIWLADDPIPGAVDAVSRLRASGERVVFITNNSYPARADHLAKLERMGMATADEDLITSAGAAATLLEAGERALVLGGPGIFEALRARDVEAIEPGTQRGEEEMAAVVVGFDLKFDFARLAAATTALRNGARLIASNDDATFPTSSGLLPGAGSFVAAVARAGGVEPTFAGKPYPPLVELVRTCVGKVDIVVGDRPSTDGELAVRLGARFALVLTGVTPPGHAPVTPTPSLEAADLAALVGHALAIR